MTGWGLDWREHSCTWCAGHCSGVYASLVWALLTGQWNTSVGIDFNVAVLQNPERRPTLRLPSIFAVVGLKYNCMANFR